MTRCAACDKPLTSKNPRAEYCDAKCRRAAFTQRATTPRLLVVEQAADPEGPIAARVREQLEAVARADTPLGAVALGLAARLDRGVDTAAGMAAAAKQLEATLASATKGADTSVTPVSSLRERRDAKLG